MKIHKSVSEADKGKSAANEMSQKIQDSLSRIKTVLFVMSGKGGVGKSSVSTNLAASLADRGFKTGLMDVDLHGPSIAQMFGIKSLLNAAPDGKTLLPTQCGENLKVVSMQSLIQDPNQSVIWRGPAKAGMINQFIGSVKWDDLDFLVVDAPPGTGDEPLTVVQTIPHAKALIITTPQDVALADVRKSINFCQTVNIEILGLIENMGPFKCPCCNETIELFKSGGGKRTSEKMNIDFLGTIPFDPEVVKACDDGTPISLKNKENNFSVTLNTVIDLILKKI